MDTLLQKLIRELAPDNVLLFGQYAGTLCYPKREKIYDYEPCFWDGDEGKQIRIITAQHASYPTRRAAGRIREYFVTPV